jgi:hypothetical protein
MRVKHEANDPRKLVGVAGVHVFDVDPREEEELRDDLKAWRNRGHSAKVVRRDIRVEGLRVPLWVVVLRIKVETKGAAR